MREELRQKIMMLLYGAEIEEEKINNICDEVTILLNDYDIATRETAIVVRSEERNAVFLKKFLIAKTVGGRTERTLDYYRKTLQKVLEDIGKPADEISTDDIRLYLALRQKRDKISKVTANNELRCLSSFYTYLHTEEMIIRNPCLKIEKIKEEKKKKKAFTEMDVEKIRAACRTARETALVEILLSTGCRVTEVSQIKIDDLENDRLIVHGKGEKDRIVYLNAKAQLAIRMYLAERKDKNEYLFPRRVPIVNIHLKRREQAEWYKHPNCVDDGYMDKCSIETIIRGIGARAGVEKAHPHRFRRTCATFALRRGMPIEQVSKMLGHNSIDTTQIYLDLSEEELQQAHKKYVV